MNTPIVILPRLLFTLMLSVLALSAQALTVESEGRTIIGNQSLEAAKAEALRDASQQALIQAGAYISSVQSVNQGVMGIDNLQMRTLGKLTNVQILDERVTGNLLIVKIRADVEVQDNCPQASSATAYQKQAAVTAFALQYPGDANLGDLHNAPTQISNVLSDRISSFGPLRAINAGHIQMQPNVAQGATTTSGNNGISEQLQAYKDMDVQFVIAGVIRDMKRYDPSMSSEGNFFTGLYDAMDYRGQQHMRNFAVEVFVYDGFTGALLTSKLYRDAGMWRLNDHDKTGFGTAAFLRTDYGQKVNALLSDIAKDVNNTLKCEPFRARIVDTDSNIITLNAGTLAGLRPGDKLTVYRKSVFYDPQQQPHVRLENTHHTLLIKETHPRFSKGSIDADTQEQNIQQDDVVLAW